jgi:hypothetical protein
MERGPADRHRAHRWTTLPCRDPLRDWNCYWVGDRAPIGPRTTVGPNRSSRPRGAPATTDSARALRLHAAVERTTSPSMVRDRCTRAVPELRCRAAARSRIRDSGRPNRRRDAAGWTANRSTHHDRWTHDGERNRTPDAGRLSRHHDAAPNRTHDAAGTPPSIRDPQQRPAGPGARSCGSTLPTSCRGLVWSRCRRPWHARTACRSSYVPAGMTSARHRRALPRERCPASACRMTCAAGAARSTPAS